MNDASNAFDMRGSGAMPETTGRMLVLLDAPAVTARETNRINKSLADIAGISAVSSREFDALDSSDAVAAISDETSSVIFAQLGVAVVTVAPDQRERLMVAAVERTGGLVAAEPERVVYAMTDYLGGYRDGVTNLVSALRSQGTVATDAAPMASWADDDVTTWGLKAIGIPTTSATGAGARVAVLDTGVDVDHPDLAGRLFATASFVAGETVDDGHGHGTHCLGTVGGSISPVGGVRFGVAPSAELLAGKVLSNAGRGGDAGILAGIQWAIEQHCHVVSMSLGADVGPNVPYSTVFETVAARAVTLGTLIVAAAGNGSNRGGGRIAAVGHPANCPSIVSVAAIDSAERIANFSSGTVAPGGQVDVAGPGVSVLSAWNDGGTRRLNGTSMATPHTAGVAALIMGAREGGSMTAWELKSRLMASARRLPLSSLDSGSGLVTAPRPLGQS